MGGDFWTVDDRPAHVMKNDERLKEISGKIIGAAMEVHNCLRPGQDEKIYERALQVEFELRGLRSVSQRQFPVVYKGVSVGTFIPDFVVEDLIIVDPKVVSDFTDAHTAQMLGYLAITNLPLALLINFKNARLEWKRIIAPNPRPNLLVFFICAICAICGPSIRAIQVRRHNALRTLTSSFYIRAICVICGPSIRVIRSQSISVIQVSRRRGRHGKHRAQSRAYPG